MKQVKIIEADSKKDMENQLNAVYSDCNINGYHVIATKMLSASPRVIQVIFDVPENGRKNK